MSGVIKLAWTRNERIREAAKVVEISEKVKERRSRWYDQVMGRDEDCVGRGTMGIELRRARRKEGEEVVVGP